MVVLLAIRCFVGDGGSGTGQQQFQGDPTVGTEDEARDHAVGKRGEFA